jgi:histidyl-tRNA synthetase
MEIEMTMIQAVRGTREFYPEDMAFRIWLYNKIRDIAERFGYQEYDGPFIERLELYAAKSGEELVKEQAYVFEDRSGSMVALRPELTPSLARMVATRSKSLSRPLRWWSFGPFWRYERTQKGRSREFFQWNIDLLGVDSPQADAELAAIASEFFRSVGLTPDQVRIMVNNRPLVEARLAEIGINRDLQTACFRLIDRRDRMTEPDWRDYAVELGITGEQIDSLTDILSDTSAWERSEDLIAFFDAVDELGVSEFVQYDPTVIRGLDYYTGTVYEAKDLSGEFRSIFGGGRYDNLVSEVGGDPVPATGFAMGDMVFRLVLESFDLLPVLRTNPAQILVSTFSDETISASLRLACQLRSEGMLVEWYPEPVRLSRQLKYADREGIPVVIILGPDETEAGSVTVKNLRTGSQESILQGNLPGYLRKILA